MSAQAALESTRRATERLLGAHDVRHQRQQLAHATCSVGYGLPLALHFHSGVVGKGTFLRCERARRRQARAEQVVSRVGHDQCSVGEPAASALQQRHGENCGEGAAR